MKNRIFKGVALGILLAVAAIFVASPLIAAITSVGKEPASAVSTAVSNPVLRVSVSAGAAANTSFLSAGIDYGDVILQAVKIDSAGTPTIGFTLTDITLDSLYWQDKTHDTLACGLATAPWLMIFYYDLTD